MQYIEHALDMLEAAKLTNDPAKIAKAEALLARVREMFGKSPTPAYASEPRCNSGGRPCASPRDTKGDRQ